MSDIQTIVVGAVALAVITATLIAFLRSKMPVTTAYIPYWTTVTTERDACDGKQKYAIAKLQEAKEALVAVQEFEFAREVADIKDRYEDVEA